GRTIASLEHLDGPVQVTFDDGHQDRYDLVVGADGLRSTVRRLTADPRPPARRLTAAPRPPVPVGQHSWRFLAPCPPAITTWTVMLGPRSSFLTIPIGGGLRYCFRDALTGPGGPGPGGD